MKLSAFQIAAAVSLCLAFCLSAPASAAEPITEKSFGCMHEGTKVKNTYIRHSDPAKLKEAVRIYETGAADTDYPAGTVLQLVPNEAMVKHAKKDFPKTNGWEFFAFEVSAAGTKIVGRGDTASNPLGTCLSCHQGAVKYDYVCDKTHGCPPVPITDAMIVAMQAKDARCTAK